MPLTEKISSSSKSFPCSSITKMKRPLACIGFTFFTALLCLNLIESTAVSVSLLLLGTVLFITSFIFKSVRQTVIIPTVLFGIVSACLLFYVFQLNYERIVSLVGENTYVSGTVAERPSFSRENRRYYCVIKAGTVGGSKVKTKLRLSFSETYDGIDSSKLQIGDRVSFTGTVYKTGAYAERTRYS